MSGFSAFARRGTSLGVSAGAGALGYYLSEQEETVKQMLPILLTNATLLLKQKILIPGSEHFLDTVADLAVRNGVNSARLQRLQLWRVAELATDDSEYLATEKDLRKLKRINETIADSMTAQDLYLFTGALLEQSDLFRMKNSWGVLRAEKVVVGVANGGRAVANGLDDGVANSASTTDTNGHLHEIITNGTNTVTKIIQELPILEKALSRVPTAVQTTQPLQEYNEDFLSLLLTCSDKYATLAVQSSILLPGAPSVVSGFQRERIEGALERMWTRVQKQCDECSSAAAPPFAAVGAGRGAAGNGEPEHDQLRMLSVSPEFARKIADELTELDRKTRSSVVLPQKLQQIVQHPPEEVLSSALRTTLAMQTTRFHRIADMAARDRRRGQSVGRSEDFLWTTLKYLGGAVVVGGCAVGVWIAMDGRCLDGEAFNALRARFGEGIFEDGENGLQLARRVGGTIVLGSWVKIKDLWQECDVYVIQPARRNTGPAVTEGLKKIKPVGVYVQTKFGTIGAQVYSWSETQLDAINRNETVVSLVQKTKPVLEQTKLRVWKPTMDVGGKVWVQCDRGRGGSLGFLWFRLSCGGCQEIVK